ncbi:hypothetical protein JKP88DRAFT_240100 [Tribonema minus]|uniref:Uncharacterized protein n=1 Tax=Tribonema minus TaxID=303371 RepID=A0A835YZJ6_9STRA|nr:hypothetical protein JKP88DRAFT_240100 [Tribonema minus]
MQASWLTPKASCFMTTRVLWEGACRDWCLPGRNRGAAGRHPVRRGRTSADAQTCCTRKHYEAFQLMSGCLRHNLKATHTLPSWHTVSPACEELASGGGGSAEGVCGTCMQRACGWRWRQRGRRMCALMKASAALCRSSWSNRTANRCARWRPVRMPTGELIHSREERRTAIDGRGGARRFPLGDGSGLQEDNGERSDGGRAAW